MSPKDKALVGLGVALLLLFLTRKRPAPTGEVIFGIPTVTGSGSNQFGGTDYGITVTPTP